MRERRLCPMCVSVFSFYLLALFPSLLFFVCWRMFLGFPFLFLVFWIAFPFFALSFLARRLVAIQECLIFYCCSPCFYSLAIASTFPPDNVWLFDINFIHSVRGLVCFLYINYLYLVLSSLHSTYLY